MLNPLFLCRNYRPARSARVRPVRAGFGEKTSQHAVVFHGKTEIKRTNYARIRVIQITDVRRDESLRWERTYCHVT